MVQGLFKGILNQENASTLFPISDVQVADLGIPGVRVPDASVPDLRVTDVRAPNA